MLFEWPWWFRRFLNPIAPVSRVGNRDLGGQNTGLRHGVHQRIRRMAKDHVGQQRKSRNHTVSFGFGLGAQGYGPWTYTTI